MRANSGLRDFDNPPKRGKLRDPGDEVYEGDNSALDASSSAREDESWDEMVRTDELKPLEDRAAFVEVWWLSPGLFRAADRFSLGNIATPPFGFPRSDIHRKCRGFFVRT